MSGFVVAAYDEKGHEVAICADEVASFYGHTVTSYTYEEHTKVTLKSGVTHNCRIPYAEFKKRLHRAMSGEQA